MTRLADILRAIIGVIAGLGVLSYGCAALVTVADIIGRTIGLPVAGVVEMVQLFVVTGTWLVIPYAFLTGAHVGVDFILMAMPRRIRRVAGGVIGAGTLALIGLMLWYAFQTFSVRTMFGDKSQQLGIPIEYYWYPLLTGLGLSLVAVVLEFFSSQRSAHHV
ncbi:TRAP transporter small permease [Thalassovita aquimarina]|uniref:TRAP transporter small permease protein n=1 Tax=Thalassovita aquimarina TaxID=2785917 RepID=A0ABS5HRM4_9RHOB|nr:TRAP transporter small permease [Thalassovita aquimarina]MBR9651412.1 TRAP transporter small permease [Thalassovita aquimarina]